jgi:hypothetical protein
MKTEITIDGITYKVGDVLERYGYKTRKITAFGKDKYLHTYPNDEFEPEFYDDFTLLKNWKIKKPKKKIVIERWINTYKNGTSSTWSSKANADFRPYCNDDRIACEYVKFEYEIDE